MDVDVELAIEDEDEENCAYESTGNVFADVALPDAAELHARSELMILIMQILRERKLSEAQGAELLETTPSVVSALLRGRLDEFSITQLFGFLEVLGYDAEITVHPRKPMKKILLPRRAKAGSRR